jgi:hypothetical protein
MNTYRPVRLHFDTYLPEREIFETKVIEGDETGMVNSKYFFSVYVTLLNIIKQI